MLIGLLCYFPTMSAKATLNARQESFARGPAEGMSQRPAYMAAGYDCKGTTAECLAAATKVAQMTKNRTTRQRWPSGVVAVCRGQRITCAAFKWGYANSLENETAA